MIDRRYPRTIALGTESNIYSNHIGATTTERLCPCWQTITNGIYSLFMNHWRPMTIRLLRSAISLLSFTTIALLFAASHAQAQGPRVISYQGVAFDDNNTPLVDGEHSFTFTLYPSATSKAIVYTQTSQIRTVNGLFSALIGPLPEEIPFNTPYWLGISINASAELTPRTELTSVPYALNANSADTALVAKGIAPDATGVVTAINGRSGNVTLQGGGNTTVSMNGEVIQISSDPSGSGQSWELQGNTGTDPKIHFIGTNDVHKFEIRVAADSITDVSSQGYGRVLFFEGNPISPNLIGGYRENARAENTEGATIAGGGSFAAPHSVGANFGTIGGGSGHLVTGENGTIGGGLKNSVSGQGATISGGMFNSATSNSSTIGGGQRNTVKDLHSTISGGKENRAESLGTTIGGGQGNGVTGLGSTIGGGINNLVFGNYGFVGGGEANATSREYSTVSGGRFNNASAEGAVVAGGFADTASGDYAAVVGGIANRASNLHAFTGGGEANHSDGRGATIAGGSLNRVQGDYSAIPGGRALTLQGDNSFGFLASPPQGGKRMSINAPNVAVLGNVNLWLANNDSIPRQVRFYGSSTQEGTFPGLNTNYSSFEAADQTARIEYILPERIGNTGDFLSIASVNGARVKLSWQGLVSDKHRKENFLTISGEDILQRFRSLELGSWNYRGEQHRHYGIMAQDFNAAFGKDALGNIGSDSTLQISDLAGVAYLAIQALEKRTDELQQTQAALTQAIEELKKSRSEEEDLRKRLERLEAMIREAE